MGGLLVVKPTPIVTTSLDLEGCTDGWGGFGPLRYLLPVGVEHILVGLPGIYGPFRVHVGFFNKRLGAFGACTTTPVFILTFSFLRLDEGLGKVMAECPVLDNALLHSCEVKRGGVEISKLCLAQEILDPDVNDI